MEKSCVPFWGARKSGDTGLTTLNRYRDSRPTVFTAITR